MSENAIGSVLALIICMVVFAAYWKQIAAFVALGFIAVFCVGVYYIVTSI